MISTLKEIAFVVCLGLACYVFWLFTVSLQPPDTSEASKPNAFILNNPEFRKLMGPSPQQVQMILEGTAESVEAYD